MSPNALTINQLQSVGSHNSYRMRTYEPIFNFVSFISPILPAEYNPQEWDYDHVPLPAQFNDYGMRSIELDIYNDPEGGRFSNRAGLVLVLENPDAELPALEEPGMKILHIPDFDYMTHYLTFKEGLTVVRDWSRSHPMHVPLYVMVELKTETIANTIPIGFTESLPFDAAAMDAIDAEIKSIFGEELEGVLTPDEVRAGHSTLEEAVLAGKWPSLAAARGNVVFVAMMGSEERATYLSGHGSLRNRPMFVFSEPGQPEAAFLKHDDPIANFATIQAHVRQGYMVRTRADAGTWEARSGDYGPMEAAFASGAQIISTDYYKPDHRAGQDGWTDYHVTMPGGVIAQPNPLNTTPQEQYPIQE